MLQPQAQTSELNIPQRFTSNDSAACPYLWRDLYLRAIFEPDRAKVSQRIREAERALMQRERELSLSKGSAERGSVISALNCLQALRACVARARTFQDRA